MTVRLYEPQWPGDLGVDTTTCRAAAFDRLGCVERQCRMRPLPGGLLCWRHAREQAREQAAEEAAQKILAQRKEPP